jgi:hypothetical protein
MAVAGGAGACGRGVCRGRGPGFVLPRDAASRPRNAASIAWHVLLRRTYDVDAQVCGRCGDRMRVIAVIQDPAVAARIVDHLARPGVASARGPP